MFVLISFMFSNIALSTCLCPVSVVLERIQAAKINHLRVKLHIHFPINPFEFPTFDPSGRYSPHISSHSTPNPTYTSSPETSNLNPDSYLIKEPHGVTPEEPMFWVSNNKVNQLCWHTHAYLQSTSQILVIYKIPRARTSHRRTQPYGENETLASSIDDLIIDTISEIRQQIVSISHSKNQEDPEFQNFLDFLEVDSTFYDLLEA